jgi:hypothetical protein
MKKLLLGALLVTALALPVSAFTADSASARTPHGFTEGKKTGWHRHHSSVPPGWHHGNKVGWGSMRTMPPGLRR